MDGYDWVRFEQIGERCTPKMAAVLRGRLDLQGLLGELSAVALAA
jgi:hypothetical protein